MFVKVTTDCQRRRDWLELTFEYRGKLQEFSAFLATTRQDLWENGLHTREINLTQTGLSGVWLEPDPDPTLTGFAIFKVQARDELISTAPFVEGMRRALNLAIFTPEAR
jgi:hypothetical protein